MILLQLAFLFLCLIFCSSNLEPNSPLPAPRFRDYESRTDEISGEALNYYSFSPYYVKNSSNMISLDGSTRNFTNSFVNNFDKSSTTL